MQQEPSLEKLKDLIEKLHQRFDGAIQFLKQTPVSTEDKREKLFNLPWFLLLGFPSSGKTSVLSQTPQNFILSKKNHPEKHRVSHCEWWATREAVFLDVNNAYILQNRKTKRQRKLWFDFLELLQSHKKQKSFDGILFAIDIEKLCSTNKNERSAYFHSIRGRLKDLALYSKQAVPIYLIVTKIDKLAGFNEFFDNLTKAEVAQLWGITLNQHQIQSPQILADNFDLEFDRLLSRLNQRLIQRLHQERNIDKRAIIKDFPLQVESIKKPLAAFLQNIADITSANQSAQLRGLYLCAAHPQGEVVLDRLHQPLSLAFPVAAWIPTLEGNSHRAYFTADLFKQLLKDREIALTYIKHNKAKFYQLLKWTIATACALLVVSLAANWVKDFSDNISELNSIEQAMAQYQLLTTDDGNLNITQSLAQLSKLAEASANSDKAQLPWAIHTFLPKDAVVYQDATQTFKKTVQLVAVKALHESLQTQLADANNLNPTKLYSTLQAYLMLNNTQHFDTHYVATILDKLWVGQLNADQLTQMNSYIAAAYAQPAAVNLDQNTINEARLVLGSLPKQDLAMALFAASLPANQQLKLDLPQLNNKPIFTSEESAFNIPAAFTAPMFAQVYDNVSPLVASTLVNGDWVLTDKPANRPVTLDIIQQVRQFYIASYIKTWQAVLANLQLAPFTSYDQAVQTLLTLTAANSPVMQLLYQVQANTEVTYRNAPTPISLAFAAFNQANQVLATNQSNLLQIAAYLEAIEKNTNAPMAALEIARTHALLNPGQSDAFTSLNSQSGKLAYPYSTWFDEINHYSLQLIFADASKAVTQIWQQTVYNEFTNNLSEYYPFDPQSADDLARSDFDHFFAPEGSLNQFIQAYITPFADTSAANWQAKSFNGVGLTFTDNALAYLQKANQITHVFYSGPNNQFNVSFLLRPVNLSDNIKQVYLSINDQTATYAPTFMIATHFDWPGKADNQSIAMIVSDKNGKQEHDLANGDWALFHWLDNFNAALADNKLELTYQKAPFNFALQLTDNNGRYQLPTPLLHGFALPNAL